MQICLRRKQKKLCVSLLNCWTIVTLKESDFYKSYKRVLTQISQKLMTCYKIIEFLFYNYLRDLSHFK